MTGGEAGVLNGGEGVAGAVAAASEPRPDAGGVQGPLDSPPCGARVADVFEEPQLAAGPQDPGDLGESGGLVGHRAQDEGGDGGVARAVGGG